MAPPIHHPHALSTLWVLIDNEQHHPHAQLTLWVLIGDIRTTPRNTIHRPHVLLTLPLHGPRLLMCQVWYLIISQLTSVSEGCSATWGCRLSNTCGELHLEYLFGTMAGWQVGWYTSISNISSSPHSSAWQKWQLPTASSMTSSLNITFDSQYFNFNEYFVATINILLKFK